MNTIHLVPSACAYTNEHARDNFYGNAPALLTAPLLRAAAKIIRPPLIENELGGGGNRLPSERHFMVYYNYDNYNLSTN